jgi:hypothetical protein
MESNTLVPPWIFNNKRPRGSIQWRMGSGEEFYNMFYRKFSDLSQIDQTSFIKQFPEPASWVGFYKMILDNPWPSETA